MATCVVCESENVKAETLARYETEVGGLKVVLVESVVREACGACGEATIEIPDLEGLAKAVALGRALVPWRLHGRDVRLMRTALGMNGREFAEAMNMQPETISRWENGNPLGAYADTLLRHNACALLHRQMPALEYEPADIATMRVLDAPADADPPLPTFRRVVVRCNHRHEDVWDQMPTAA